MYGINIQSQPGTKLLPVASDIAFTLGFKLSDRAVAGIGGCYKLGWGNGWKINITNEGFGFRTYADIKAGGSFWLSGGMEYNYLQSFNNLGELYTNYKYATGPWQKSGLIGVTKKIPLKSPQGKSGKARESNVQILYDLLNKQHYPSSQAIKFRIGWTL